MLAGKDNECVVSLEGGREGRGGEGRKGGEEGRGGREGGREGREGGDGGRGGGMTVIHILIAPQYLNNNHVTFYVIT